MEGSGSEYAASLHGGEENEVKGGGAVVGSERVVARRLFSVAEGLLGGFGGLFGAAANHLACCHEGRLLRKRRRRFGFPWFAVWSWSGDERSGWWWSGRRGGWS